MVVLKKYLKDFSGGTVDKNPLANAGDMGLIPGRGTISKIPHTTGQLNPQTTTRKAHTVQ